MRSPDAGDSLRALLAETRVKAFDLIESIARLGRIELRRDARALARAAGGAAICALLLGAGYALLLAGLLRALSAWIPAAALFAAAGAAHLLAGLFGLRALARRLSRLQPLHRTKEEIGRAVSTLRGLEPEGRPVLPGPQRKQLS